MTGMVQLALIGDVHRYLTPADIAFFNDSDYDLILVVGDLADWWPWQGETAARMLAGLGKPALFIPGNHDTVHAFQLIAEVFRYRRLARLFSLGHERRARHLQQALGPVSWAGYSTHSFALAGLSFDVVVARPLSQGGPALAYRPYLQAQNGVTSLAESADLLCRCVDAAVSDHIIFLAHNGPAGLGGSRSDIWGRDFVPDAGDHGDPDLQAAVAYAVEKGKRVIAVVAGHMHHRLSGGGHRTWHVDRDGIHYINAARVPRIFEQQGQTVHHHLRLSFDETTGNVAEILVPFPDQERQPPG
jgi:uncharacterized protein (TIGR04168 family)